jgi:shikimate dehydrogenase
MKRLGLLGKKIPYSRSPQIHRYLAAKAGIDISYDLFQTEDPATILNQGLDGFNITVPYKESLLGRFTQLDERVKRVGAANTALKTPDGYHAFNTDYDGFGELVRQAGIAPAGQDFAVLGSGGASKCAVTWFLDHGARRVLVASRTASCPSSVPDSGAAPISYEALRDIKARAVVNTTPRGTDPNQESPLEEGLMANFGAAIDLVYNPFLTPFLRQAIAAGIPAEDGLDMLTVQALRAFELWIGAPFAPGFLPEACAEIRLRSSHGVALVGMPFSGKSTILAEFSAQAGVPVVDLDAEIERRAGVTIPQIFEKEGEAAFRSREHDALRDIVSAGPHLMACGGGVLTRAENLELLKRDLILHVDVPLEELSRRYQDTPPGSRPLVKCQADLAALYARRRPLYLSAARVGADGPHAKALIARWLQLQSEGLCF